MIKLVPMSQAEYDPFMAISIKDQTEGQVLAGEWQAQEADEEMNKLMAQFLPQGLNTPNHFFFSLEPPDSQEKVGGLWYTIIDQGGKKMFYVMDIQIYLPFRRQGHAEQAFHIMETQARDKGIDTIALHVFAHNVNARAMYEKLGYVGDDTMVKILKKE
ncbi:MAG: GNAT family N-acetyltransferase [Anaerolineaceae bacterium]|nr:GNAT family N-acetyltransferase [Anaerolineaceae bacterium]